MKTEKEREAAAKGHAYSCLRCLSTAMNYGKEIDQAIHGGAIPDELASKIRARLCRVGAGIFDEIVGVK